MSWGPFAVSSKGIVVLGIRANTGPTEENPWPKVEPWSVSLYLVKPRATTRRSLWGFDARFRDSSWRVFAPHWFLLIVTGVPAVYLKRNPRLRFSLSEIFVFITIAACALGVVVTFVRLEG